MRSRMNKVGRQCGHGMKGYIEIAMLVELLSQLLVGLLVLSVSLVSMASAAIPQLTEFITGDSQQAAAMELQRVQTAVTAYQADHDGDLPTVEGFPRADEMNEYLFGGVAALRGTYALDGTTGMVTQTSYQGGSGLLSLLALFTTPS